MADNLVGGATPGVTLGDPPVPGAQNPPSNPLDGLGLPSWVWNTSDPSAPSALSKYLPLLAGLGPQALAAYLQQAQYGKGYDYLNQINQKSQGQSDAGQFAGGGTMDQANAGANGLLNGTNPWSQMLSQGLMGNIQSLNNMFPGLIGGQENNLVYQDPNMSAQLRAMTDLTANSAGMAQAAGGLINSGGVTGTQSPLAAFAQMLMGGSAPGQSSLLNAGTGALNSNGMTPELANALQVASGIASGGGRTPLTDQLAARGQALAASNPLMSLDQTASFAQDQSAHQYKNAAQNARAQAVARGAGAGATVANGAGNDAMADYSDDALNGTSQAMQQALLGRQSLGLQQLNSGLNTGLSAAQLQQALQQGGLGALTNLTNASTGRLGVGGNLTTDALNSTNQGASFYNALLGLQQGNTQMGFQNGLAATGQQQNTLQTALQDLMQGRTSGANIGNTLAQLYMGNNQALANGIGQGLTSAQGAVNSLGSQGNTWLDYATNAMRNSASTGSSMANLLAMPNTYSSVLNNIGGGLTNAASGGVTVRPGVTINTGNGSPSIGGGGVTISRYGDAGGTPTFNGSGDGSYDPFGNNDPFGNHDPFGQNGYY